MFQEVYKSCFLHSVQVSTCSIFLGLLYVKTKDITSPKCNLTYFKSCIFHDSLEDIATEYLCPMFGVDVRTPIDEDP